MPLKCEGVFPKIRERLAAVDPNNRKVLGVFQYYIKQNGAVVKSVCTFNSLYFNIQFYILFEFLH